jgi:hypothetical protein
MSEKIDNPVIKLMAVFADLCSEKREVAYFDRRGLISFLKKNKEEFPKILHNVHFHPDYDSSEEVDNEMFNLIVSRLMCSWGMYFNPHQILDGISHYSKKIPKEEKDCLRGLAKKMYDELGCDKQGILGRHTQIKDHTSE